MGGWIRWRFVQADAVFNEANRSAQPGLEGMRIRRQRLQTMVTIQDMGEKKQPVFPLERPVGNSFSTPAGPRRVVDAKRSPVDGDDAVGISIQPRLARCATRTVDFAGSGRDIE
jgi:hypothetical protein